MRRPPDYLLLLAILALVGIGILLVSSASSVLGIDVRGDPYAYAKHQFTFGVAPGLAALAVLSFVPYRALRRLVVPFLAVIVILLVLVFVPGLGWTAGGAARWIRLGAVSLQPAEFAKLALLLYIAALLAGREVRRGRVTDALLPFVFVVGLVSLLILAQPDVGTLAVTAAAALLLYASAGAPLTHLAGLGIVAIPALLVIIRAAPYRVARFATFLQPSADPTGAGYHVQQALLAIGSGGLLGLGLGRSHQKFQYLPEPAGDAILAIAAEELGFFRIILLLGLYLFLILRGYQIARAAPDAFGRFVASGITSWFFVQTVVHVGANTGLLPLTGVPLPFVSLGGSALVTALAGTGILVNISRHAR